MLAEERALLAWAIRRDARVETRQDIGAHWRLVFEARDLVVYGHVNGPEFSLELRQAKEKGLTGDAVYEEVIDSACRTSEKFDEWSRP